MAVAEVLRQAAMRRMWNGVRAGLLGSATRGSEGDARQWISRAACIVTVTLMCVQAGAQVTPPSGTPSPALRARTLAVPATPFPKSDALLPTGTRENKWGPFEGQVVDAETGQGIAGAAIIVHWMKPMSIFNPAIFVEGHDEFDDARWAVADQDGHFVVPRRDAHWFRLGTTKVYLSCVAPEYLPYDFPPRYSPAFLDGARLREGALTLRLRKAPTVTREESIRRHDEFVASNLLDVPSAKREDLAREINHQRGLMGMRPILILYGELE